jgi:4-hydroxy-tetrahydrodipicolinate reductase
MGSEVISLIKNDPDLSLVGGYSNAKNKLDYNHINSLDELISISDAIIDFSSPELMQNLLERLVNNPKPLVSGTTGHNNLDLLENLSRKVPVLWSANMSIGINLLISFSERYAKLLREFDISIFEMHHKNKTDSPSGTAILMKKKINNQLPEKNIDILSVRAGEIFGQHSLIFVSDDEVIKLEHTALNRSLFAKGAVLATKKISKMPFGLYSMQDLLNV